MLAEPIVPTVDTITWEDAITIGSAAWESAEESKWSLGDIGAIVSHKWQGKDTIKNFANSIGMHDNPRRLYEYVQVAQHYPKSARAQFPMATWSSWRECSRHGLTPAQSLDMMRLHSDKPVAAIRRAILGTAAPKPVRVEFEANGFRLYGNELATVFVKPEDVAAFRNAMSHEYATLELVVTWTAPHERD